MKILFLLLLLFPNSLLAQQVEVRGRAEIPKNLKEVAFSHSPELFFSELSVLDGLDWKDSETSDLAWNELAIDEVNSVNNGYSPGTMVHAFLVQEPRIEILASSESTKSCRDVWQELWLVKVNIAKVKKLRVEIDAQFRRLKRSDPVSAQADRIKKRIDALLQALNRSIQDINLFAESQASEVTDRLVTYTFALNGRDGRALLADNFLGSGEQAVLRMKMPGENWIPYSPDSYSLVTGFERIQPKPNRTWILQRKIKPTTACQGKIDFTVDFVSSWQKSLPTDAPYLDSLGDVLLDPLKPVYKVIVRVHSWVYDT